MPRKVTVTLVETFGHQGEMYSRYRRQDNGQATDIKIMNRASVILYSELAAQAEAERRLRAGRLWRHPHLVR